MKFFTALVFLFSSTFIVDKRGECNRFLVVVVVVVPHVCCKKTINCGEEKKTKQNKNRERMKE